MSDPDKRDILVLPVSFTVLAAWLASLIVGFITKSYVALTFTTPLMIALAGYVFGVQLIRGVRNGNGGNGG